VFAYTLETGTEFQPPYAEAENIMTEVAAGLVQFCLECVCAVTGLASGTVLADRLEPMRAFRDEQMLPTPAGARLAEALIRHGAELTMLLLADDARRDRAAAQASPELRDTLDAIVSDADQFKGRPIPDALRLLGG